MLPNTRTYLDHLPIFVAFRYLYAHFTPVEGEDKKRYDKGALMSELLEGAKREPFLSKVEECMSSFNSAHGEKYKTDSSPDAYFDELYEAINGVALDFFAADPKNLTESEIEYKKWARERLQLLRETREKKQHATTTNTMEEFIALQCELKALTNKCKARRRHAKLRREKKTPRGHMGSMEPQRHEHHQQTLQ